jgi:hypothetical protein
LEDRGTDGIILLNWVFKNEMGRHGLDLSGSRNGQLASCYVCDNEPWGSIKCWEFLD